jgi:hypothetical protein
MTRLPSPRDLKLPDGCKFSSLRKILLHGVRCMSGSGLDMYYYVDVPLSFF